MSDKNSSLKGILRWRISREQPNEDITQFEESNQEIYPDKVSENATYDHDSDESTLFDEFSTDVIPASFPTLNTNNDKNILKSGQRQDSVELLNEIESISSDITDSLIVSPKIVPSAETSQEIEFIEEKPVFHYELRSSGKRNVAQKLQCKRRKQQNESEVADCSQPVKRTRKKYPDVDSLLQISKCSEKLSVKERKCMIPWIREALSDIRNETESMILGQKPVPSKMYIQTQLNRSKKLCTYLILLYEEFPSNSQKMVIEEVQQVQEHLESELRGILDLFKCVEASARSTEHQNEAISQSEAHLTERYPTFSPSGTYFKNYDNEECENKYINSHEEQIHNAGQKVKATITQNTYNNLLIDNTTNLGSSISLNNSTEHVKNYAHIKYTACSSKSKITLPLKKNSTCISQIKKRVHFNLENNPPKIDTEYLATPPSDWFCQSHDPNQKDIDASISVNCHVKDTPILEDSVMTSSQGNLTQETIFNSPSLLQNFSQLSKDRNQNSTLPNIIPESSLDDQSKQILIPLHQFLPNTVLPQIKNYALNPTGSNTIPSTPQNPVYVIIVNENKSRPTSSLKISHKPHLAEEGSKDFQLSNETSSQGIPNLEQFSSLFDGTSSLQELPNINEKNSYVFSDNLRNNGSLNILNKHMEQLHSFPQPEISKIIPNKNQNSVSSPLGSKKTILHPSEESRQLENIHLTDQVHAKQSKTSTQTKMQPQIQNQFLTISNTSFLNINKDKNSNISTPLEPSQNNIISADSKSQPWQPNIMDSQTMNESQFTTKNNSFAATNTVNYSYGLLQENQILEENINITKQNSNCFNVTMPLSDSQIKFNQRTGHIQPHLETNKPMTQSESIKQTNTWIKIVPPKLPWQTGETISESQFPEIPRLPSLLLDSTQEFKNFKIPKLPWELTK